MPYKDPKLRIIQRKIWRLNNRERCNAKRRELRAYHRAKLLTGKECANCGISEIDCLGFFYREDTTREIDLKRAIRERATDALMRELEKCDVLCFNCSQKRKKYKPKQGCARIAALLRTRLCLAIKNGWKTGSAVNDLGCSITEFKAYIERQFEPEMTWDNWSRDGWHIDHKIPLSSFDLGNRDDFLKAVHYTNLRPLWAKDNWKKGKSLF